MDLVEIFNRFPTQESCVEQLERARWPKGPQCPYCLSTRKITKDRAGRRYHCNACNTGFSVTVNTIFHDTKLPLRKWFFAISLMLSSRKDISAKQLQRDLRTSYKTAWYMTMRIRRAIVDDKTMLKDIVEVDETFIGGKLRKENEHPTLRCKKRFIKLTK